VARSNSGFNSCHNFKVMMNLDFCISCNRQMGQISKIHTGVFVAHQWVCNNDSYTNEWRYFQMILAASYPVNPSLNLPCIICIMYHEANTHTSSLSSVKIPNINNTWAYKMVILCHELLESLLCGDNILKLP
jgi:hypothetical protein